MDPSEYRRPLGFGAWDLFCELLGFLKLALIEPDSAAFRAEIHQKERIFRTGFIGTNAVRGLLEVGLAIGAGQRRITGMMIGKGEAGLAGFGAQVEKELVFFEPDALALRAKLKGRTTRGQLKKG